MERFLRVMSASIGMMFLLFLFGAHGSLAQTVSTLQDTDRDGIPDVWETTVYHTDPLQSDTDRDGFSDYTEIIHGYNPLAAGALTENDADHDGLSDRLELLFGTDPTVADSNGNGKMDGQDVHDAQSPTSTAPVALQKSLFVHLKTQKLEMRVNNIPIMAYAVSTGLPRTPTPVGTFKVLQKNPRAWSTAAKLWMPYWMHFSGRGHGIHELPEWPNGHKEGASHLGHLASHGCVRLGVGSAKTIYDWSPVGTPVIVSKL